MVQGRHWQCGIGRQDYIRIYAADDEVEGVQNNIDSGVQKISTRQWAENNDTQAVSKGKHNRIMVMTTTMFLCIFCSFVQLFENDIDYLLSMEKLWQKRRCPIPLKLNSLSDTTGQGGGIYPRACVC